MKHFLDPQFLRDEALRKAVDAIPPFEKPRRPEDDPELQEFRNWYNLCCKSEQACANTVEIARYALLEAKKLKAEALVRMELKEQDLGIFVDEPDEDEHEGNLGI